MMPSMAVILILFLSTLSLRRATVTVLGIQHKVGISIHALLAESDGISRVKRLLPSWISIHALLAESDQAANGLADTPPQISIHALLAESDLWDLMGDLSYDNFYPRSPCGERLVLWTAPNLLLRFLSTLSLRRATVFGFTWLASRSYFYPRSPCGERHNFQQGRNSQNIISIHALLAESDSAPRLTPTASRNFYPRSPCGERQ